MKIKKFHVDSFADQLFQGNPAAVCLLEAFLDEETLTCIAAEHNLAETAFVVREGDTHHIRWFTPTTEVELCGHATLAAAFVIFNYTSFDGAVVHFKTKDVGSLFVRKDENQYVMDFPADPPQPLPVSIDIQLGIPNSIETLLKGKTKYLAVLGSEEEVRNLDPNLSQLMNLDLEGVIFTAKSKDYDFVSRFFCPKIGINEDPVTGSAHTVLAPYWASQLGTNKLIGRQLSKRGGNVQCQLKNDRVELSGKAKLYSQGEITL